MTTLSVPIPPYLEESIKDLVKKGRGSNKAEIVRNAITLFIENEAVMDVLRAQNELTLKGDIKDLMKKIK